MKLTENTQLPNGEVIPKGSTVTVSDNTMKVTYPDGTSKISSYDKAISSPSVLPDLTNVGKGATGKTTNVIKGFNETETKIINEAQGILDSKAMSQIQQAHASGQPVTVVINGRTIQYEPNLPGSGMTMFGENGFLNGPEAFKSKTELQKTVLHELHRLNTSNSASAVSGTLASQETKAAYDFAEKASGALRSK